MAKRSQPDGVEIVKKGNYELCLVTFKGTTATLNHWATITGINRQTLYVRLRCLGWPVKKALETKARQERHGMWGTPERNVWNSMIQRCTNPNVRGYGCYGGRGVKVCQEWLDSFLAFYQCVGPRPSSRHTLERKNNDGDYEPGNVIWALPEEQYRNTRRNVRVPFAGKTMILIDWARETGLPPTTLWNRLFTLGWSVERALTTPKRR